MTMEDFEIDELGCCTFKSAPDFESPDRAEELARQFQYIYVVTVQASDGGTWPRPLWKTVTVEVTNVEEPGTVMMSTLQPQVGVANHCHTELILIPLGMADAKLPSISWQWYRGNTAIAGATLGGGALTSTYNPAAGDIGSVLSAKAMYDDDEGDDRAAQEDSAYAVREAPTSNVPPTFPTPVGPR